MKVFTPKGLTNKIKLWSLRAIFDCDGVYNIVMCEDIICDFFGIERDLEKTKIPEVTNVLKKELARLEKLESAGKIGSNANLRANLELVKNTLNLSEAERDLLEFLVICKSGVPGLFAGFYCQKYLSGRRSDAEGRVFYLFIGFLCAAFPVFKGVRFPRQP